MEVAFSPSSNQPSAVPGARDMASFRKFLIAAALTGAPLASLPALVPTQVDQSAVARSEAEREYQDALRSLREAILPAGERDENWDVGGADIEKAIRDLGVDKFYLLRTGSPDGAALVTVVTDRPISDFAQREWRVVDTYGSADAVLENPGLTFGYLSPRYVLGGRTNNRRVGSAACADGISHAILYEVPGAPESAEDKDLPEFFKAMMLAIEGQTLCSRADGDASKGWSMRQYFPDGRLVLNPDRSIPSDRITIVPAAPVGTLIKPPLPPAPATPQP
jgi:hypothetical protein